MMRLQLLLLLPAMKTTRTFLSLYAAMMLAISLLSTLRAETSPLVFDAIKAASKHVHESQYVDLQFVGDFIVYSDTQWRRLILKEGFAGIKSLTLVTGDFSKERDPRKTRETVITGDELLLPFSNLLETSDICLPSPNLCEFMNKGFGGEMWNLSISRSRQRIELNLWSPIYIYNDPQILNLVSSGDRKLLELCVLIEKEFKRIEKKK